MFDLKNKKVTIVGAARSGLAAAELVLRLGGLPKISDSKPQPAQALAAGISGQWGGHTKDFIQDSDYVVLSPGVSIHSQPVQWAKEAGIAVMGEVELAWNFCPCPVVAITGSNGKTTTTTLIAAILKQAGRNVCLCGNIGSPLSGHVLNLKKSDIVVLEISSFQLESIIRFKPHVAVWLNFSQNHLDRHKDLAEYFDAKKRIFMNQDQGDFAVLNAETPEFHSLGQDIKAQVVFFNGPHKPAGITNPNYLAAMAATEVLGVSMPTALEVFEQFKGVEHRLELVRTLHGVDYINDSKSTTAEAGRWALERVAKPMVMICGGRDKHIDFSVLKEQVARKVKYMITIGESKELLKNVFGDIVPVETSASFEEAIKKAQQKASAGEAVVLSPMCASFDMFNDYEHRGRVFKEIVEKLT